MGGDSNHQHGQLQEMHSLNSLVAYKSLSSALNEQNNLNEKAHSDVTPLGPHGIVNEENNLNNDLSIAVMGKENEKFVKFGRIAIGTLKSNDQLIFLRDIVEQFQQVVKKEDRIKLIKSFASKKLKVNEFQSVDEVYGLLELIILLVIKLKYKNNVSMRKDQFRNDLSDFVEWIVEDKEAMHRTAWAVDDFALHFDHWVGRVIVK